MPAQFLGVERAHTLGGGAVMGTFFFGLVLLSHTLFFGYLAATKSGGLFFASLGIEQPGRWGGGDSETWIRRKPSGVSAQAARSLGQVVLVGRADSRALIVKDIRTFWRDTTQWGQSLILLGLLVAYIMNLRYFSHRLTSDFWIDLTSYLNLGACALNLATLTTRFVFPQISLEGKRVWIVEWHRWGCGGVADQVPLSTAVSMTVTMILVGTSGDAPVSIDRIIYFKPRLA